MNTTDRSTKQTHGFTVVETAAVIVILATLVTLVIVSFGKIQILARDNRRVADVRSIATRIQEYYDQNGEYPPVSGATLTVLSNSGLNDPTDITSWNFGRNALTGYCDLMPRWGGGSGSLGPSCRNYGYLSGSNATGVGDDGTRGPGCNITGNSNNKSYYAIAWYDESSSTIKYAGNNIVVTKNATSTAFPGEVCQQTNL